ncbi:hypothetical protein FE257_003067 [Aspergillus nanangensis]|uniref:Uncharacterized protein n=1 Tax=Aspergillus nanangensis TaxID=2582783 RepID=A0AAD4CD78_ASPNN|nr:hypothetical protein FE257_003067 [Aspergillus nanangensis]
MSHQLSIEISGAGEDPNHRSHWAFAVHQPSSRTGDLLHVRVLDLDRLWYGFEFRRGTRLGAMQGVGLCKLAPLDARQRQHAEELIRNEPPPTDGKRKCQDWIVDALIALEVEELVPGGTAEFWSRMVGKPARLVCEAVGGDWTSF